MCAAALLILQLLAALFLGGFFGGGPAALGAIEQNPVELALGQGRGLFFQFELVGQRGGLLLAPGGAEPGDFQLPFFGGHDFFGGRDAVFFRVGFEQGMAFADFAVDLFHQLLLLLRGGQRGLLAADVEQPEK